MLLTKLVWCVKLTPSSAVINVLKGINFTFYSVFKYKDVGCQKKHGWQSTFLNMWMHTQYS